MLDLNFLKIKSTDGIRREVPCFKKPTRDVVPGTRDWWGLFAKETAVPTAQAGPTPRAVVLSPAFPLCVPAAEMAVQ